MHDVGGGGGKDLVTSNSLAHQMNFCHLHHTKQHFLCFAGHTGDDIHGLQLFSEQNYLPGIFECVAIQ